MRSPRYVLKPPEVRSQDAMVSCLSSKADQVQISPTDWESCFFSIPPSECCRSDKVQRLLIDGVPQVIRHRVWGYSTNSMTSRIDGLFAQLVARELEDVPSTLDTDVEQFVDKHPNVCYTPLVTILRAYMAHVPDIRYHPGLVSIAGFILLQCSHDEEDAFWLFVSLMNTHMRPFFSDNADDFKTHAAYIESYMLEKHDLLMGAIRETLVNSPLALCRAWFPHMFVDILPIGHLLRVWDYIFCLGVQNLSSIVVEILTSDWMFDALGEAQDKNTVLDILEIPFTFVPPDDPNSFAMKFVRYDPLEILKID
ncbi:rab-GTPase-TBC domain-containing protein [Cristinia sonorae]|uniref:Rab-GTPase-TBC domain-containing protein n=1 Tax=Cristinia sonorae TaxID=1940300 RepID=A0A8K0UT55_9AGAR|nr:rab-GTPase-TBC domain-containing protein [Cristinia sonorae]